ncbi:MAG TPA: HAD-IA family hydrolase [Chloroflexota bacterium]|nr:HAD-IA family hydrolase [Chloroflexota bacterium]
MSPFRALIFDFDGLILDTEGPEYQSWCEIYAEHGCELDFDLWATCIGTADVLDPYAELERLLGRPIDREGIRVRRRARNQALLDELGPRPGVVAYLEQARERGMMLAVASSSARPWVAGHLERLGLLPVFDALACADEVEMVKPDPALYLLALAKLGRGAAEALALEDSPNGVLAAKRAGLRCVAVPNDLTRRLSLDHADRVLDSLAEVSLADLLAGLT